MAESGSRWVPRYASGNLYPVGWDKQRVGWDKQRASTVSGPNVGIGNPLGDGGERLHAWMWREEGRTGRGGEVLEDLFASAGAVLMGRRMFDLGEEPWGDDPPFHRPVFVVTHRAKATVVKQGGTTYTFVTDGLEGGDRDVVVLGGAAVIQQCIRVGLLDELRLHIAHHARRRDQLVRRPGPGQCLVRAHAGDRRRGRHAPQLPCREARLGPIPSAPAA
jgi:dihydrofolate reductase